MQCKQCSRREQHYGNLCKVCAFKKRNSDKLELILSEHEWCEADLDLILDSVLYQKIKVINELTEYFPTKSLDDIVDFIEKLNIGGAVPKKIQLRCFSCGCILIRSLCHYHQERVYCSLECRDLYKSNYLSGHNSQWCNRIQISCTNCGKEFEIIPSQLKSCNIAGESHNFCSRECYADYRSQHYRGEKHPMFGKHHSEQVKEATRERIIQMIHNDQMPQTMTTPHIKICNLLSEHSIEFVNEYSLKYYSIDIYLPKHNMMIEIMGDYWHGSPLRYHYDQLNKQQLKSIKQDKSKHTYIKKYYDQEILYLWEFDINHHIELCWSLIQEYIKNGCLSDYNSYNYSLQEDKPTLNNQIIHPFFYNTESLSTAVGEW